MSVLYIIIANKAKNWWKQNILYELFIVLHLQGIYLLQSGLIMNYSDCTVATTFVNQSLCSFLFTDWLCKYKEHQTRATSQNQPPPFFFPELPARHPNCRIAVSLCARCQPGDYRCSCQGIFFFSHASQNIFRLSWKEKTWHKSQVVNLSEKCAWK